MRYLPLLLCLHAATLGAAPRVVTSIAPLQEITAAITAGITQPDVVIEDPAAIHHFAFRPSQLRLLQQADLIIWVDRHFEGGFYRLAESLPESTRTLELMTALGEPPGDGHIWFSPRLLLRSAEIIAAELARLDPLNRDNYLENSARLAESISQWRDSTQGSWKERQPRVVTDHDFLGRLAREFGLSHVFALHDEHDAQGSIKNLNRVENRLRREPVRCLLTLASDASPLGRNLAEKYQLRTISIASGMDEALQGRDILHRLEQLVESLNMCR
jgi:zinc transport system substrate-binding protein